MKKIILFLSLTYLTNCHSEELKSFGELEIKEKKVAEFKSGEADLNRAIKKIKKHLTPNELDSFYVSGIDKTEDSVKIILFHYDLMEKIKGTKEYKDDQWIVLPPLSTMPNLSREFIYLIKDDQIVDDPTK